MTRLFNSLIFLFLFSVSYGQNVLIIHDNGSSNANTLSIASSLENEGFSVTLTSVNESSWNNTNPSLSGYNAVIHLNGTTYSSEMPTAGQNALNDFVEQDGGLYIGFEWNSYQRFSQNQMTELDDLILFQRNSGWTGSVTHNIVSGQENHPLMNGIQNGFSVYDGVNVGTLRSLSNVTLLMKNGSNPLVAVREFGNGHILNFAMAANYNGSSTVLSNSNIQQIITNAINTYAAKIQLKFYVDVTAYAQSNTVQSGGIRVAGTFPSINASTSSNNPIPAWNPSNANSSMNSLGNNLWVKTINVPKASVGDTLLFKFVNYDWTYGSEGEGTGGIVNSNCALFDGNGSTNRYLVVPECSRTYKWCWNSCFQCNNDTSWTSPTFNFNQDTLLSCGLNSIELEIDSGFNNYLWTNGDTNFQTIATESGMFSVQALDSNQCDFSDSVYVSLIDVNIENTDTSICIGDTIALSLSGLSDMPATLISDLEAYWTFENSSNDVSGLNRNLNVFGSPSFVSDRFLKVNSAIQFSGVGQYLKRSASGFPTGERTVSIWFFSDVIGTGSSGRGILGYGGGSCGTSWLMNIDNSCATNGANAFEVQGHCNALVSQAAYGSTHPNGEWHHLVATTSPEGTEFFLDGESISSTATFINNTNVSGKDLIIGGLTPPNGIGYHYDNCVTYWDGLVDDVAIWSRRLSASEVSRLYAMSDLEFEWSTGDTTASINVSPIQTTTYYVTITDGVGLCEDSITIIVSDPVIAATFTPTDCQNTSNGIISSFSSGGLSPYQYAWSNSASTASISQLGIGAYSLTVTDSIGCEIDSTFNVIAEDTINPNVVTQNLTIYLDASGAASITAAQVDNGSLDNCGIDSLYLNEEDFDCSDLGTNSVTLTAVDTSGNSSSANS